MPRLITTGDTRYVVNALHEILRGFDGVHHLGLTSDLWYSMGSQAAYEHHGYATRHLPRSSGSRIPWWQAPDPIRELTESRDAILALVDDVVREHRPEAFLTADDTGPMEVLLIERFRDLGVPSVLLQHGPGGPTQPAWVRIVRRTLRRLEAAIRRTPTLLPDVRPPGLNGTVRVCSHSGIGRVLLARNGARGIAETGFPYFDMLHRSRPALLEPSSSVLLVSTGGSIFGDTANTFTRFVQQTAAQFPDRQVFLRLKPGETPRPDLHGLVVRLDDNSVPSHEAVQRHGLVVGESSTVLLEAIIMGRPAALCDAPTRRPASIVTLRDGFEHLLGIRAVGYDPSGLDECLRDDYLRALRARLDEHEDAFFHRFDGQAAARVRRVLLDVAATR